MSATSYAMMVVVIVGAASFAVFMWVLWSIATGRADRYLIDRRDDE